MTLATATLDALRRIAAALSIAGFAAATAACGGDDKPVVNPVVTPVAPPTSSSAAPPHAGPVEPPPTPTSLPPATSASEQPAVEPVVDPYDAARRDGKPLLAVLVPEEAEARSRRARVLETIIADLSPWQLASLAPAAIACLSPAEVEAHARGSTKGALPFAVLVETEDATPKTTRIEWPAVLDGPDAALSADVTYRPESEADPSGADAAFHAIVARLEEAVDADSTMRARRAKQARSALAPAAIDLVESAVRDDKHLDDDVVLRAAAVVLLLADASPDRADHIRAGVGRALRARLRFREFPGAGWVDLQPIGGVVPMGAGAWCGTAMDSDGEPDEPRRPLPAPTDPHDAAAWAKYRAELARERREAEAADDDRSRDPRRDGARLVFLTRSESKALSPGR